MIAPGISWCLQERPAAGAYAEPRQLQLQICAAQWARQSAELILSIREVRLERVMLQSHGFCPEEQQLDLRSSKYGFESQWSACSAWEGTPVSAASNCTLPDDLLQLQAAKHFSDAALLKKGSEVWS